MVSRLQHDMFRSFVFVSCVWRVAVVCSVICYLLDRGIMMGWTVSKEFGRKLVDEVSDRFSIKCVVQMGDGSTDHSQALISTTWSLRQFESHVILQALCKTRFPHQNINNLNPDCMTSGTWIMILTYLSPHLHSIVLHLWNLFTFMQKKIFSQMPHAARVWT